MKLDVNGSEIIVEHELYDVSAVDAEMDGVVTIEMCADCVNICIRPFGKPDMMGRNSWPISIEFSDGEPRLLIWSDHEQDAPTHVIPMKKFAPAK